jgi:macrodomain Ter protein organizer (MatP/YcbG family)
MNAATDIVEETAEPLDDGVERGRARLRGLGRAGEVGEVLLGLVERLAVRTVRIVDGAGEDDAGALKAVAAARDLALAYAKVSRSIRQNALLEDKLEAELRDRISGLEDARRARALKRADAEAAKAAADEKAEYQRVHGPRLAREAIVAEVMEQLIYDRYENEPQQMGVLRSDLADLLEEGAGFEAYGDRPVSETVTGLCQALELDPDWEFFAQEDWAKDEARAGVAGSPYVSTERGGTGDCVLAVRGLQGAGLAAPLATGPP